MANKSDNNNEFFLQNQAEEASAVDTSKSGKYKKRSSNLIVFPDAHRRKNIINDNNLKKKDIEDNLGI